MTTYHDPGWGPALRRTPFLVLIPFLHLRAMRTGRSGGLDGLSVMRMVFLYFIVGLLLFLVVLVVIDPGDEPDALPTWTSLGFAGVLVASLAGVFWARSRPLDVSDEAALAASYRATFFLGIAFAESAALFGFVGVFLVGRLGPYLIGLAVSLLGFAMIAPTRSNIERRQGEVTARGSTFSLGHAVMTALPTRPPDR